MGADLEARLAQASDLIGQGKNDAARQLLLRLAGPTNKDPRVFDLLRLALSNLGQVPQSLYYAQRCADLAPDHPGVRTDLGILLHQSGKLAESERAFRAALALDAGHVGAYAGLAALMISQSRLAEAEDVCAAGLERDPGDVDLQMKAGAIEMETFRSREAFDRLTAMRRGEARSMGGGQLSHARLVEYQATLANYAGLYAEDSGEPLTPVRIASLHREAASVLGAFVPVPRRPRRVGPMRVAVVSPDFRRHPVASFFEPVVAHADRSRVRLIGVHVGPSDGVTARLRAMFDEWHDAGHGTSTPAELAALLARIDADVIVELAGFTLAHVLPALRTRPGGAAQVTYLGYPNTTGCAFLDARLVDSLTDPPPPGVSDALCSERLVRMDPCFLCYLPPIDAPEPRAREGGGVVFGCFNRAAKIGRQTLSMWAGVLGAVPGSRMILKDAAFVDGLTRERVGAQLRRAGIDPLRVELSPPTRTQREHLERFNEIDIALDCFPYHGTTTTCEALLMGRPVVTLAGPTHVARVGVSLLTNAGLPEVIAGSPEEYVRIASELAGDRARLTAYHATIGARFRASPVCDGRGFAARFVVALEGV